LDKSLRINKAQRENKFETDLKTLLARHYGKSPDANTASTIKNCTDETDKEKDVKKLYIFKYIF